MDWDVILFSEGKDLQPAEIIIRTILIFLITLILVRIAKKRFLGRNTAFDIVLGVVVGSVASRAINGSAKVFPTLIAVAVLIFMHWAISFIVSRSQFWGKIIEGKPAMLIKNGNIDYQTLKQHHLRELDIMEAIRLKGNINDIQKVKEAHVEANGEISIVKE